LRRDQAINELKLLEVDDYQYNLNFEIIKQ